MMNNPKQDERANEIEHSNCAILIVDDSEVDRFTYRRYLEAANIFGCNILDCDSAEAALDTCEQNCPSIILLDYLLPGTDGLQFLQELAERVETLPPVIMLTGQGNETVAVEAMKQGARDYLVKGQLTPLKLVNAVTSALIERKLQAQIDRQFQQQQLLASIRLQIGESIELSRVLQAAVDGCRQLLDCDRASIYKLNPDLSGQIVAESVLSQWSSSLGQHIEDDCFDGDSAHPISKYLEGRKFIVSDIDNAQLSACYVAMLKQFQVRALIVVPILFREVASLASKPIVWGLLIVHQCRSIRTWLAHDIDLTQELSIQMAVAIQQAELVSNLQATLAQQQIVEQQLRDRVIEIEQTNIRLSVATRLLEKRNQELDEFACIASHDLQAPLRGIANLTDWLSKDLEGNLPPENQEQIDLIQVRVLQMDTLIKGLLQYARVGRENVESTSINLSQTIAEAVETIAPSPNFQVHFPTNLPTVKTQALLLRQVFANLIGNAIRYHDRDLGNVEILAIEREYLWEFTVVDDGPGIAAEHHKKIFGIFQTLTTKNEKKGTGVGLAIVQKIVESRGGSIWVKSSGDRGSAFSFTWIKTP
jgi:signal transduction histidine kinase/DNA-binding NarL/FixJ family response regulator